VAGPHVPVVVGIHTCEVETARMQLLHAKQLGAAAVLVKYVGNPKATGPMVLGFFHVLAEMNVLPIFYYHFPSNTGLKLTAQEVAGILSLPGVVGIKESTLNLREVQAHIALTRGQGKTFLSGSALNLTQFMDLGGHGAMCPEGVLLPGPTVQAYHAYFHGQREEARSLQNQLFTMTPILRDRSTPAGITRIVLNSAQNHKLPVPMGNDHPQARMKGALNCLGVPTSPVVKCALPQLTAKEQERVQATVAKLQKIDWCEAAMKGSPAPYSNEVEEGGMLLKTGSFILGPNVGRDLLRSMSDGKSGF
jgi:dihydrodipicolinate synthase/N-acetylneuraminate lyase